VCGGGMSLARRHGSAGGGDARSSQRLQRTAQSRAGTGSAQPMPAMARMPGQEGRARCLCSHFAAAAVCYEGRRRAERSGGETAMAWLVLGREVSVSVMFGCDDISDVWWR
jgi:hypothetical protein